MDSRVIDLEPDDNDAEDVSEPATGIMDQTSALEYHEEKRSICSVVFSANYKISHPEKKSYGRWQSVILAYQTLGVVYGDLGTSPLYVFSSIDYNLQEEKDFLGVLSLIFWTLTLIAVVKYAFIVLRADDHGEGGTFAVYSLLSQHVKISQNAGRQYSVLESDKQLRYFSKHTKSINSRTVDLLEGSKAFQRLLLLIVMIGTSMVIGDGVLTPAISVLSAVVGIKSQSPKMDQTIVVAVSVVIILLIFSLQRIGTIRVSFLFSPVMLTWFLSTALIGIYNIAVHHPGILKGLSPHYIVIFFARHSKNAWVMLGAVVLCITGSEAMFADLGHFSKHSIQIAFTTVVFPSLILTYAGEAAYLIKNPADLSDTFFKSTPHAVFLPIFIISTLAAVVASQALISATFSIIKQSMALGCFPRVKLVHTSTDQEGQIYSPEVNYTLMVLCIILVLGFRSGTQIGNAFGVAVIWVMLITTFLITLVMLVIWRLPLPLTLAFFCVFGLIEGVYMTSVMNKIPQGGWVQFLISAIFLTIMFCWNQGRQKKYEYESLNKVGMDQLAAMTNSDVARVPGVCFFYSDLLHGLPPIIGHYVRNVGSLKQILVIVTIRFIPVKTVLPEERFLIDSLGLRGIYRCIARYGYMDAMELKEGDFVDQMIDSLKGHISERQREGSHGSPWNEIFVNTVAEGKEHGAVYVIGKSILKTRKDAAWFERLVIDRVFAFLATNCRSAIATLCLPPSKLLQVGMVYEI